MSHPSRALTLVEVMFALVIQATVMLAIMGSFIQSRRVTESAVLHAAATSLVYGLIEQIKELDYTTQVPSDVADPYVQPTTLTPPYVRVRINQSVIKWIQVVHTLASTTAAPTTPQGPTTTPDPTATAASVGAIDNWIGSIPLSTVTGSISQQINLNLWLWIDDIPDATHDVLDAKKFTLVYTYSYQDGSKTRTIRDMEVFVRTHYDQ